MKVKRVLLNFRPRPLNPHERTPLPNEWGAVWAPRQGPEVLEKNKISCPYGNWGRASADGIATRYGLEGPGIEYRWGRDF
jgi:hypothetical protein